MANFDETRQGIFLQALRETCNVTRAAQAAGVSTSTVYSHKDNDALFAERYNEALEEGLDMLEDNVRKRAFEGLIEPVFHQGYPTFVYQRDEFGHLVYQEIEIKDEEGNTTEWRKEPLVVMDPETGRPMQNGVRKYSDGLAQFFLKAHRPEKYRERSEVNSNFAGFGQLTVVTGVPQPDSAATPSNVDDLI